MHVDTHLLAVADDVSRFLELDAILCRPLARLLRSSRFQMLIGLTLDR
jgi:hypothetical protein